MLQPGGLYSDSPLMLVEVPGCSTLGVVCIMCYEQQHIVVH